jgi:hypothetical protein
MLLWHRNSGYRMILASSAVSLASVGRANGLEGTIHVASPNAHTNPIAHAWSVGPVYSNGSDGDTGQNTSTCLVGQPLRCKLQPVWTIVVAETDVSFCGQGGRYGTAQRRIGARPSGRGRRLGAVGQPLAVPPPLPRGAVRRKS